MNRIGRQRLDGIARREDDSFHGSVIRQHRNKYLRIDGSFAGRFRDRCAQGSERLNAASRPVVNREGMSRFDQVTSYRRSHISQTNESYLHPSVSFP
jgi:hypothetical protein